jgi:hypothetical protein
VRGCSRSVIRRWRVRCAERTRNGCRRRSNAAVVGVIPVGRVALGVVRVLRLRCGHPSAPFAIGTLLCRRRTCVNTMRAAVVGDATVPAMVLTAIGVRVIAVVAGVGHRGVVVEVVALPTPTVVAVAVVPISVVDAAIEADRRPPVTGVPCILAVVPAPVTGRPVEPDRGRLHPGPGHPIVAVDRIVGPIPRLPNPVWSGGRRLHVIRNRRRTESDGNADADRNLRACRCGGGSNKQRAGHRQRAEDQDEAIHGASLPALRAFPNSGNAYFSPS